MFETLITATAVVAGAVASVTGFGIGSLLTPLLAIELDTRVAVAAVSVPHAIGTALRLWLLHGRIDWRVFWSFGIMSAAGGLTGALLHWWAGGQALTLVFGALLLFVAASEATGLMRRVRFHGWAAWVAGAASGLLGGLVGNQGGVRSAALLGYGLSKELFVATATAIGLVVDAARVPVYLVSHGRAMADIWLWIALASLGVVTGTLAGSRVLRRVPEHWFRPILAVVLALLGGAMVLRGVRP